MHRRRTSLSLILLLFVPALAAAQAPRTIALDDLHAIKAVSGLAVSPDGRQAVYVVREVDREKDRRVASLWRVPVEGGTPERLVHGASDLSSPSFSPDGRYLAFVTTRDLAAFGIPKPAADRSQVFVLPTSGGEAFPITAVAAGVSSYAWAPDGRRLVVGAREDRPETPEGGAAPPIVVTRLQHKRDGSGFLDNRRTHLHILSVEEALASGGHRHAAVRQLTEGPHDHSSAEWSPDGRHIVFASNRTEDPDDNNNSDVWVLDVGTRQVRQVTTDPGSDGRAAWSPDGRWIAYVHTPADPPVYAGSRLMVVPAAGGTPRNLTERLDRTVSSRPRWAPDSSSIYVTVDDDGRSPLLRVSLDGRVVRAVEGDVGDVEIARDRFVALMATPSRPTEVYAIPDGGGAPVELSRANADLFASLRFNTPEEIRYRSGDGTPIHGWVIRPPDFSSGARYPLLLRIHGGPVAQYTDSFSFEFQYLASLGYVVVFSNPRGSTGYGEAFSRAIFADWGNRDYEDVVAGVEHVIAKGYADPQKLGVGGWSYGGILTNYVITKTARFAAAISGAGSSDMFSSFGVDDVRLWWLNELGAPWDNVDLYRRLSPIYDVAKVTTPTLFVVGDQDYRVPLPQSEQFYVALRTLGRPTGMIIYPGQAHGITRPSYQTDRLRRYGLWYDKYVKGLDVDPMFETWEPVKKAPPEADDRGAMSTSRVLSAFRRGALRYTPGPGFHGLTRPEGAR